MTRFASKTPRTAVLALAMIALLLLAGTAVAGPGNWWDVTPEPENPSPFYDSILYSEIPPKLREIEQNSNRVKVEVIGQSAGGRNLFLVTLSDPQAMGRLGQYQAIRNQMLKDPAKAQAMIDKFGDFKVPVFINGSIHGNEYPGVDAAIRLIETLAYDDSPEVQRILQNVILLVNVVQNPDGRVLGTRANAAGFDLNRDFISQTQPETAATIKILTEWNPMVTLDLHGFVNPMLIEPTTPPHNPNYEYDLYLQWAFNQALAMEAELFDQTGLSAQIPFRDDPSGWDDWGMQYVPMYSMYHGSYGHTLETPSRAELGVDAHYAAVWGALNFIADNRPAMLHDQIEIFRRGVLDLPQMLIPQHLLDETIFEQYNELTITEFPAAYIIPVGPPFQQSTHAAARLVEFLLFNDVEVQRANQNFVVDGISYPRGSYVVWMDQAKRGLANTILGAGVDLSEVPGLDFYSAPAAWSHPLLWGAYRAVMEDDQALKTSPVNNATPASGSVSGRRPVAYAFEPVSLAAFQAANALLDGGTAVRRAPASFVDGGRSFEPGTFIIAADKSLANQLARDYALDLIGLGAVPAGAVTLAPQRIAVFGDNSTNYALDVLGFDYDVVGTTDLNNGALANYDIFVNRSRSFSGLNAAGKASAQAFFAGGGDYVGYRSTGIAFAKDAGAIDVTYSSLSTLNNGIVEVAFDANAGAAGGFRDIDYAYVEGPAWFTAVGPGVTTAAAYATGDFFISGYWPGWPASGAAGRAAVAQFASGDSDVTVSGLDLTFRGHPESTFRILGNAIFGGVD